MSDEILTKHQSVIRRLVRRNPQDRLYYVVQNNGSGFERISKGYAHSTSAYAKLGRIMNDIFLHGEPRTPSSK